MEATLTEVYVVDNNSRDGSEELVKQKFPWVTFIANKDNVGFSKANNQAIRLAKGKYVLLLNPDTVVEEDTFEKCIDFMDQHPDAGGLGVNMVDGKGQFLPESKRGLPTPAVAFYKIFGLANLFPKSKKFGQYHLGFLDKNSTHKVDILSGAFMLIRKTALDKVGLLDEDFFMYGEDIDLSWRIKLGGFENYYFPETRIIHYKGESTKKSSINYVFVFYRAMIIFASKHFSKSNASLFSLLINLAIYFRAFLSIIKRMIVASVIPVIDGLATAFAIVGISSWYQQHYQIPLKTELVTGAAVGYGLAIMLAIFLKGGYDKPISLKKVILGNSFGVILSILFYSILPEEWRFSRMIILLGGLTSILTTSILRIFYHTIQLTGYSLEASVQKRIGLIGSTEEVERVKSLICETQVVPELVVEIAPDSATPKPAHQFVGSLNQIDDLIKAFRLNELVFCAANMKSEAIISYMASNENSNLEFKIAPPGSEFIIGSNSINSNGELYSIIQLNNIASVANKRNKRIIDLFTSICLLILSPILVFIIKKPFKFLTNLTFVLIGLKTWVSYDQSDFRNKILPKTKKGIIYIGKKNKDQNFIFEKGDFPIINYTNKYKAELDLQFIWKNLFLLGS